MSNQTSGCLPAQRTSSRLVEEDDTEQELTANQETDSTTAMSRGLAEFLRPRSIALSGLQTFQFNNVFESYADLENAASYPSLAVVAEAAGSPDEAAEWTPSVVPLRGDNFSEGTGGPALVIGSEEVQVYTLELWATNDVERMGCCALLEAALMPVDWMVGFRLELPHYFNLRATYEPISSMQYLGDDDSARTQRYYRAQIQVRGRVNVARLKEYVRLHPRVDTTVDGVPARDD